MGVKKTEAFPPLTPMPSEQTNGSADAAGARRRRKSSNLGGDPRGDTGAGALATRQQEMSPLTSANGAAGSGTQGVC